MKTTTIVVTLCLLLCGCGRKSNLITAPTAGLDISSITTNSHTEMAVNWQDASGSWNELSFDTNQMVMTGTINGVKEWGLAKPEIVLESKGWKSNADTNDYPVTNNPGEMIFTNTEVDAIGSVVIGKPFSLADGPDATWLVIKDTNAWPAYRAESTVITAYFRPVVSETSGVWTIRFETNTVALLEDAAFWTRDPSLTNDPPMEWSGDGQTTWHKLPRLIYTTNTVVLKLAK